MQLLVSVRDAVEAAVAVAGGADIVDAKDPAAGALGPVAAAELAGIRAAVPHAVPLSAALGEVSTASDVTSALSQVPVPLAFVKFGFGPGVDRRRVERLLRTAVKEAGVRPGAPAVIAVGYADWKSVGGVAPLALPEAIAAAGAQGLLLDTAQKHRALRELWSPEDLLALGAALRARGLRYALGGGLGAGDVALARAAGVDVMGVRGSACTAGRTGPVDLARVQELARSVLAAVSADRLTA